MCSWVDECISTNKLLTVIELYNRILAEIITTQKILTKRAYISRRITIDRYDDFVILSLSQLSSTLSTLTTILLYWVYPASYI